MAHLLCIVCAGFQDNFVRRQLTLYVAVDFAPIYDVFFSSAFRFWQSQIFLTGLVGATLPIPNSIICFMSNLINISRPGSLHYIFWMSVGNIM